MGDVGHNSVATSQLKSVLERIENLDDERGAIMEAMKEVYSEAKGNGFDTKAIRKLVSLRRQDRAKLAEDKAMLELYATALGCLDLI